MKKIFLLITFSFSAQIYCKSAAEEIFQEALVDKKETITKEQFMQQATEVIDKIDSKNLIKLLNENKEIASNCKNELYEILNWKRSIELFKTMKQEKINGSWRVQALIATLTIPATTIAGIHLIGDLLNYSKKPNKLNIIYTTSYFGLGLLALSKNLNSLVKSYKNRNLDNKIGKLEFKTQTSFVNLELALNDFYYPRIQPN